MKNIISLYPDSAAIEFFPQQSIVIQWWQNATKSGDWVECAVLIRGMMTFCPDSTWQDLMMLKQIARARILAEQPKTKTSPHPAAVDRFWLGMVAMSSVIAFVGGLAL